MLSINIIAEVHRMLATEGRRLTIVNPGPAVRRIINMTGLDHILDVQADKTGRAADSPHLVRHSLPVRGR